MFTELDVARNIEYGTFNKICESILNRNFEIREKVINLIKSNNDGSTKMLPLKATRPKVLLIDEVDVFFNKDFLGNLYVPSARLADITITNLLNFIWEHRKNARDLGSLIKRSKEYKELKEKFSNWIDLFDESIKDILADLTKYQSHDYLIFDDKIAYKEQDGVLTNIVYGYKTLFAYFHEYELGKISLKSLEEHKSLGIYCGCFSYCELPKEFKYIIGVTGTLESLSSTQKKIITEMYDVKFFTYMPSIYGESKLDFRKEADTLIASKTDYFIRLKDEIDKRILGTSNVDVKRAVLLFFENKESLMNFYNSRQIQNYNIDEINILTEDVTVKDKILFIKKATTSGKITFLTKSFGRGIDFICTSRILLANSGVHVIQTFLSEELSEQIQIMGRTARQGDTGSYSMVLNDEDLEKYLGTNYKEELRKMSDTASVYETMNVKRNEYFSRYNSSIIKAIDDVKLDHEISQRFLNHLRENDFDEVKKFLLKRNKGADIVINRSKTICLMDATGSMHHLLTEVKNKICIMFERAIDILVANGLPADSFEIQLAVYRDYDAREDVLQISGWETKPLNLRNFMSTVSAKGGGDYEEAIEIGLWHVNQEQAKLVYPDRLTQVILIGDAPAKSHSQIKEYRDTYGGESFWAKTKFKEPTHYKKELNKIKDSSIKVHTFYVSEGPEACFSEIATTTGGSTGFLDVNSANGAEKLINLITPLILHDVGQLNGGMGQKLVENYELKYSKSYA
jgi:hypothetical protein